MTGIRPPSNLSSGKALSRWAAGLAEGAKISKEEAPLLLLTSAQADSVARFMADNGSAPWKRQMLMGCPVEISDFHDEDAAFAAMHAPRFAILDCERKVVVGVLTGVAVVALQGIASADPLERQKALQWFKDAAEQPTILGSDGAPVSGVS